MRRTRRARLVIGVAILCGPALAVAAHPLITDDAGTLGRGAWQVELTSELGREVEGSGAERTRDHSGEGALAVGFGVLDRVDVVAGVATSWARSRLGDGPTSKADGFGDVSVDLKWRAMEVGGFALALKPGITLPTGDVDKGLGSGRPCYALTAIASQELGPVSLHANIGYLRDDHSRREDREASRQDRLHASVAAAVQAAPRLQLVADLGAETNSDRASSTWPAYALGGAIFAVTPGVDLDVGIKAGLTDPETDLAGLAGLTFRF